jgi:TonB family protein
VAHAFATRKRFYVIVSLNAPKDDPLEEKFLSSFVLPERQTEQPKTNASAQNEQVLNPEDQTAQKPESNERKPGDSSGNPAGTEGNTEGATPNVPNNNQQQGQNQKRPISGGMLNAKAIYLPQPESSGDVNGVVLVQILVDEQGSVIEARAISGPQQLHAAAVNAARLARFSPTMLMGEPVKVSGTLSYNFARSN